MTDADLRAENERLHAALSAAQERETATSEILRAISRSRTDAQPVFDAIVDSATRLCANVLGAGLLRFDGRLLHILAQTHQSPERLEMMRRVYPRPVTDDSSVGRAVLTRTVDQVADLQSVASPDSQKIARALGFRTQVTIPMVRDGNVVGLLAVVRREVEPFSDAEIALLQTFADQALIAMENARLLDALESRNRDLTTALEQQTATAEILRVISRSQTDTQPVFDTIVQSVTRFCAGTFAVLLRLDGSTLHVLAHDNYMPEEPGALERLYPRPVNPDSSAGRAILTRRVDVVADIQETGSREAQQRARALGFRSQVSLPLLRDGEPVGVIVVGRRDVRAFTDAEIRLLGTFAEQAVIAIENARLLTALQTRTAELTRSVAELRALGEVGQAVSSTLDLDTVLATIVSRAVQLSGLDGGSIYEYDEKEEEFHLRAGQGAKNPDGIPRLARVRLRKGEGLVGRLAITYEPVEIPDLIEDPYRSRIRDALIAGGHRAMLGIPLLHEDHLVGGLVVSRFTPGPFAPETVALLRAFATQSALAIQNARLYRELSDKSRQLEAASRHKSDFLASMSHEIRTPMNAILGMAELLAETSLSPEQQEYVRICRTAGDTLLAIIDDVLDLSKVEAGHLELEAVPFDLADLVRHTTEFLALRARAKGLDLSSEIAAEVPTRVVGDPTRVRQVLVNLIGNAVKFTERGAVRVRVEPEPGAEAGDVVRMSVSDTGEGIPGNRLGTIFESFTQADASVARRHGGTGLGLTISKRLVELMGGRIWVESEAGGGSTFSFTVRLGRPAIMVDAAIDRTSPDASEVSAAATSPLRVLLVEDVAENRVLVTAYLKSTPWRLEVAENGAVAVERVTTGESYDVVLMDMDMPVMDGYDATRAIRTWERERGAPPTPVIALTAYALGEEVGKSLDAGCDAHLNKPIKKAVLLETIATHVRRRPFLEPHLNRRTSR